MDAAIELATIINNTPDFTRRIGDYAKAKKEAEAAREAAEAELRNAVNAKGELDAHLATHRRKMDELGVHNNKLADEAAARIKLATEVEGRNKAKEEDLASREQDLKKREAVVDGLVAQFKSALQSIQAL